MKKIRIDQRQSDPSYARMDLLSPALAAQLPCRRREGPEVTPRQLRCAQAYLEITIKSLSFIRVKRSRKVPFDSEQRHGARAAIDAQRLPAAQAVLNPQQAGNCRQPELAGHDGAMRQNAAHF